MTSQKDLEGRYFNDHGSIIRGEDLVPIHDFSDGTTLFLYVPEIPGEDGAVLCVLLLGFLFVTLFLAIVFLPQVHTSGILSAIHGALK